MGRMRCALPGRSPIALKATRIARPSGCSESANEFWRMRYEDSESQSGPTSGKCWIRLTSRQVHSGEPSKAFSNVPRRFDVHALV
jgi:hypothetical protein